MSTSGTLARVQGMCCRCPVPGRSRSLLVISDAFSSLVLGHRLLPKVAAADVVELLQEVGRLHDLHDKVTLITALSDPERAAIAERFPHLLAVLLERRKLAAAGTDFRRQFKRYLILSDRLAADPVAFVAFCVNDYNNVRPSAPLGGLLPIERYSDPTRLFDPRQFFDQHQRTKDKDGQR